MCYKDNPSSTLADYLEISDELTMFDTLDTSTAEYVTGSGNSATFTTLVSDNLD